MTVIYDPACPPTIFDGLLDVWSSCKSCGEMMKVIVPHQKHHPCCDEYVDPLDALATGWLTCILAGDTESAALTEAELNKPIPVDLASAAVQYAQWGWHVFPLAARSKLPAIPKRKGGKGFKDATTDVDRIKRWWTRHPEHNIGLATGHVFDVIDMDTKDSDGNPSPRGPLSFSNLLLEKCLPEAHAVAVTASGGLHLYVKATGKGNFAGLRPGIDYRGRGGYVVAPPSHLGLVGRAYNWLTDPSPKLKGDD